MGGWISTWHWEDHEHDARAGCLGARLVPVSEPTCFVDVESSERLSASRSARRRAEGYVLAMLSIADRIRGTTWYQDPAVRNRMRWILLNAAARASEQRLPRLAARAALAAWRWPSPTPSLVLASGVALPLVWLAPGKGSTRVFRWARGRSG